MHVNNEHRSNVKRLCAVSVLMLLASSIAGCSKASSTSIRVGVTAGPHAEIMQQVKRVAADQGLDISVVTYDNADQIDRDLASGRLDANSFQSLPFLHAQNAAHGYGLIDVAFTETLPLAFYSKTLKSLNDLKPGDTIALPIDRDDCARALILLQNEGLITFSDDAGLQATPQSILSNQRSLKFIRVESNALIAALPQVAFAAIPWPIAEASGLQPARDAIALEDARSPYADVIAVRTQDRNQPWVVQLIGAYHSKQIKHFMLTQYQDSVRRPW